jgi:galactose-1-phosphate uridylyltransferase
MKINVYIPGQHGIISILTKEIEMQIKKYYIETNENGTQNLVETETKKIILENKTEIEIYEFIHSLEFLEI